MTEPAPWERKPEPPPQPPPIQQGYRPHPGPMPGQSPYGHMPPPLPYGYAGNQTSTPATVALVLFLVGIFPPAWLICPIITPICAIASVVCGFVALSDIKKNPGKKGKGFAFTGVIGGGVMILASIALLVFVMWIFDQAGNDMQTIQLAHEDARLIEDRLEIYYKSNGNSLAPGGKQVRNGYPSGEIVKGELQVSDIVFTGDLTQMPEDYELEFYGNSVNIYLIKSDGEKVFVGEFNPSDRAENYGTYEGR